MKTINVTDATFEEFKKLKIKLQALLNEEMSDSTALAEMLERLKASKMIGEA
jgi:predicted CopG family antitoxin